RERVDAAVAGQREHDRRRARARRCARGAYPAAGQLVDEGAQEGVHSLQRMVSRVDPVVALHGFAGTGRTWDGVGIDPIAPDLPGHGTAADVRPVSFEVCVERVLAAAPERFVLAGYSLGGRIALHVALAAPERVSRLVLLS